MHHHVLAISLLWLWLGSLQNFLGPHMLVWLTIYINVEQTFSAAEVSGKIKGFLKYLQKLQDEAGIWGPLGVHTLV